MTDDEALERARSVAQSRGWEWEGRIAISRYRTFPIFGARQVEVWSNADSRGCNCRVVLDEETGEVVEAAWLPR